MIKSIPKIKLNTNEITNDVIARTKSIEKDHEEFIIIQSELYALNWHYDVLEAKLKNAVGQNSAIRDICGWNRQEQITNSFDKKEFEAAHPDLYAKYLEERPDSYAVTIFPNRAYAISK